MATQNPDSDSLLKELKALKSQKDFDGLLAKAQEAVRFDNEEPRFTKFLHYAQEHYVKGKLDSQIVEQLEAKQDYAALAAVYMKLLTILPDSKDLKKRLKHAQDKIAQKHDEEKKQFYVAAEQQVRALIAAAQYEDAVAACHEILDEEPSRKNFIALLAKAEALLDKQMNAALELYFKDAIPALYKEYQEVPDNFIKI